MGIDFYTNSASTFCRAVQLTADNLGVELNAKTVDIFAGEQMNPEFLQINPLHQIPVISDNGFNMAESTAIMQYLANAYGREETASLYPKLTKKRAIVDQRLVFSMGALYKSFMDAYYPAVFHGKEVDEEKVKKLDEILAYLDSILKDNNYVAGDTLTIADFATIACVTSFIAAGHPMEQFPTILEYLERCKEEVKGYAENEEGAQMFGTYTKSKLAKE